MTPETSDDDLRTALATVGGEFRQDELAFLAATSKIEAPIRDRLAFMLHRTFVGSGFAVSREWNRVDIAVLDREGEPVCLIEAKAMYTFDAFSGLAARLATTTADEEKARKHATPTTAVYSLLLATHLGGVVKNRFLKPVKYSRYANRNLRKVGSEAAVREQAISLVDEVMTSRKVICSEVVEGGRAFDLEVSVFYWLVRDQGPARVL